MTTYVDPYERFAFLALLEVLELTEAEWSSPSLQRRALQDRCAFLEERMRDIRHTANARGRGGLGVSKARRQKRETAARRALLSPEAVLILGWLARRRPARFSVREVHKALWRHISTTDRVHAALIELHERRFVQRAPSPMYRGFGQRPGPRFEVVPP